MRRHLFWPVRWQRQSPSASRSVLWLSGLVLLTLVEAAPALDHVTFQRDGKTLRVSGKFVTIGADGGVLLLDHEGVMWRVPGGELTGRSSDEQPFAMLTAEELKASVRKRLPDGFQIHATAHYLIFYNTSPAYAKRCGELYDRLYREFQSYWKNRDFELRDPAAPLIAIVFDSPEAYARYARAELGDTVASITAYYSLDTNRITVYDLTGTRGLQGAGGGRVGATGPNKRLLRQRMWETIIHEATHQLAYNCGLHARFADIPLWVSEGLATYFETPDLDNRKEWYPAPRINRGRLKQFHQYLRKRPPDSLVSLLQDDKRFRHTDTALDAYAEAWSLNFYLIHTRPKEYARYLKTLAEKPPMVYDTPEQRLQAFGAAFGDSLPKLDADFARYMAGVR